MADLAGPRPRHLTVWNRSPVRLERLLSVVRTSTEHELDRRQRERAHSRAPEPTAVQQIHAIHCHTHEHCYCVYGYFCVSVCFNGLP